MKRILAFLAGLAITVSAMADEGMWLLPLLKQLNGKDLKAAGCKLTPEEIYSINKTSLKDAIVHFGGGCTGEMISNQGLLVTNHHCGYSSIQGLSTDEHNYLMDGYWAKNFGEEIPCPGLTVTFLVRLPRHRHRFLQRQCALYHCVSDLYGRTLCGRSPGIHG